MCLVKTTQAVTGNALTDLPRDTRIETGIQALNISNQFLSLIILAFSPLTQTPPIYVRG